jgi:hypothetical protein
MIFIFWLLGTHTECAWQDDQYLEGGSEHVPMLNRSNRVTVYEAKGEDFFDCDKFLNLFILNLQKKVKKNHSFTATHENNVGNQLIVHLNKNSLAEQKVVQHKAIKSGVFW